MERCIWSPGNAKSQPKLFRHDLWYAKTSFFSTMGPYTLAVYVYRDMVGGHIFKDDPVSIYDIPHNIALKASVEEAQALLEAQALKYLSNDR
jgi:hypothetical protein